MQLEQKLALIQQMRHYEDMNSRRMGACAEGSYSHDSSYSYMNKDLSGTGWTQGQVSLFSSSFRLRFLLAIFLFLLFFYLDVQNASIGFLDSGVIESYVGENMVPSSLFTLVNDIN